MELESAMGEIEAAIAEHMRVLTDDLLLGAVVAARMSRPSWNFDGGPGLSITP